MYSETGNTTAATEYCLKGLAIAREIGALLIEMEACECLSGAWESDSKSGSHSAASKLRSALKSLKYHKLWAAAKDSLFNEEKTKEITRLVTRYEMEKQYEAEKRAAEEVAVAVAEKKARSSLVQISVIGLVLGLVLIAILFSGRFAIPVAGAKVVVFVFIVFLFEFILVLLDPFIDKISGGNPAIILLCNGAVALLVFPLFNFLLTRLTQRVAKTSVAMRKVERRKHRK
ncbi:MAG: hypothetical protein IIA88_07120 [Bacteroidetes bacterium]|nr:hypothetical protein [Bacteroidota bacterium]